MSRGRKVLRIVARVLGIVVGVVLLAMAVLAVSIALDGRGSAARLSSVTNTTIPGAAGPDVKAYVATPATPGPHPVVIMIHEFWGLNPDIVSKADLLAKEGYVVVAPDAFRGSTTGYLPKAIYQVVTTPAEEINADIDAVVEWVRKQPGVDPVRVGIVGFCFGGRTSLLYALHNPTLQATSVFYGQPVTDPKRLETIRGPVLGIFGGADVSIPLEDVQAFERGLKQAGVESTVTIYPNQPHAFVKNAEGIQSGGAQGAAWAEMLRFFKGALQQPRTEPTGSTAPSRPVDDFYGWAPIVRLATQHAGHDNPWSGH